MRLMMVIKIFNEEYIRHKYQPFVFDIPSRRLNS